MSLPLKRYATALYRAAEEKGAVDAVADDLEALHAVLSEPDVRSVLTNPAAPAGLSNTILEKATAGAHELVVNFCKVAAHRRRVELLPEIWPSFQGLVRASRGEAEGRLETARPLGAGELEQLETLASSLSGKKVTLAVVENPDLIGGVRLRVGNTLYDGSMAHALEQLHKQLMAAPLPGEGSAQ